MLTRLLLFFTVCTALLPQGKPLCCCSCGTFPGFLVLFCKLRIVEGYLPDRSKTKKGILPTKVIDLFPRSYSRSRAFAGRTTRGTMALFQYLWYTAVAVGGRQSIFGQGVLDASKFDDTQYTTGSRVSKFRVLSKFSPAPSCGNGAPSSGHVLLLALAWRGTLFSCRWTSCCLLGNYQPVSGCSQEHSTVRCFPS